MVSLRHFVFLAAVLLLAACDDSKAQQGDAKAAGAAPPPPQVTVAQPLVQPVTEYREFSGRFEATDTVEIRSRISGYLMQILFKDGAIVKKGDPLFVIDPRQIEANLRQKQADLNLAQSKTTAAVNDFDRADTLFKTGDISESVLDQRRAAKDSALAGVDAAKAAVDSARVDLVYTKIAAPMTGRISRNLVSVGNLVNPGQDVLTTIVSIDPIYFYFDVDEKAYVAYARQTSAQVDTKDPGIPVMVALADEKDYTHAGTVDFVDNHLDSGTGTMRGRAVLTNADMFLTPGMFGRVRLRTGGSDKGILIPDEAITIDQSRKLVYVVDDKNMVSTRTIETGSMDQGLRIVTSGLKGGEWIVVNGLQRAHEGAPVTPEKSTIKSSASQAQDLPAPDAAATTEDMPAPQGDADAAPAAK